MPADGLQPAPTKEDIWHALEPVQDPELGFSVVGLGLVYDVRVLEGGTVEVRYTLTSPSCPFGELFEKLLRDALVTIPGVRNPKLTLTFDPPWGPEKIADALRCEMRMMGMPV